MHLSGGTSGRKPHCLANGNTIVTQHWQSDESRTEMTPVKAVFLSLAMLSAIGLWGVGIYAADAAGDHVSMDGYGVVATR